MCIQHSQLENRLKIQSLSRIKKLNGQIVHGISAVDEEEIGSVFKYSQKLPALWVLPSNSLATTFKALVSQTSIVELAVLIR